MTQPDQTVESTFREIFESIPISIWVEDEPATRSGLSDVLTMLGYETVAVEDAEKAVALDSIPAFDLLITDLMLPGLPGARLGEQ